MGKREPKEVRDAFLDGVRVSLAIVAAFDNPVMWEEIVGSVGYRALLKRSSDNGDLTIDGFTAYRHAFEARDRSVPQAVPSGARGEA